MRKLELTTKIIQKSLCARLCADVDSGNARALRESLGQIIRNGPAVVLLDLAEVRKMDSAGIAVLVEMHDRMSKDGRHLGLVNTPDAVKGLLALLGVFQIYADLDEGLRATQKLQAGVPRLHDPTRRLE